MVDATGTRQERRLEILLLLLMGIVILLMMANLGLFLRMNQLQGEVLAALAPLQMGATGQEKGLEVGTRAPNFALSDTAGQVVSLEAFAGQEVLLAFSSTHCPGCIEAWPHLQAFSQREKDVQVVMVSRGSAQENRQLVTEQGFGFPVLAWDDAIARDYQVPGTPFFYVIDEEGVIVNAGFANTLEQMEALVEGGRK